MSRWRYTVFPCSATPTRAQLRSGRFAGSLPSRWRRRARQNASLWLGRGDNPSSPNGETRPRTSHRPGDADDLGTGCFGRYLHVAWRRTRSRAAPLSQSSAVERIAPELSLPTIVAMMPGSGESWQATLNFCESTVSQKEGAEKQRESSSSFLVSYKLLWKSNPQLYHVFRRQLAEDKYCANIAVNCPFRITDLQQKSRSRTITSAASAERFVKL